MTNLNTLNPGPPAQPHRVPSSVIALCDLAVATVQPETPLLAALRALDPQFYCGGLLIVQDETLVGLLTEPDLVQLIAQGTRLEGPICAVARTAFPKVDAAHPLDTLALLHLMDQHRISCLPVVDSTQRPKGLVTRRMLQKSLVPAHLLKIQSVNSLINQDFVTARVTESARHVAQLLSTYGVYGVVVMADHAGVPLGLVLSQDLVKWQAQGVDLDATPIQSLLQADTLLRLQPSDSLWVAWQEMEQRSRPCALVVDMDNELVGLLTQSDLLSKQDLRGLSHSLHRLWGSFQTKQTENPELWNHLNADLVRLVQTRTQQLEDQAKGDRILTTLIQHIHQSLDLEEILSTTVSEIRQLLQTDRTSILRFDGDTQGTVAIESVSSSWASVLGYAVESPGFVEHWSDAYRHERIQAIENIHQTEIVSPDIDLVTPFQAQAALIVPILCNQTPWGLLLIHQCSSSRQWKYWEIKLMKHLVKSLAIAIRQSELYHQLQGKLAEQKRFEAHLQQLNNALEEKVETRTASLRKVSDQLQAVLDAVPGMVAWINEDLVYLGCNQYLAAAFQRTRADFVGQRVGFLPETAQLSEFAKAFFAQETEMVSREIRISVEGTIRHYLLVAQKYAEGRAAIVVGIDISDREQAEAALQASETKFRSLVEQTNHWVWEIDQQSRFVYVNPKVTQITGYAIEEVIGKQFSDLMDPNEAVRFTTVLSHVIEARDPLEHIETTCLHKDGSPVVLEISGAPIFSADGKLEGYRGITQNITERKQIEINIRKALTKEKELGELKTRFISMASHEFRTPLTTILASAESLERYRHKFSEEKQAAVLKRIQTSVHHVIDLLGDILTVGKAEANKLPFKPQPLNLKQFCQDLVEELQIPDQESCHAINFVWQDASQDMLADEKLLRHILVNLLSNAIKYSPEQTPVEFVVQQQEAQIIFHVSDHGIGISKADQAHLFEAFHRGNNVGNISGTGLGLVIAKRAAEAHHGTISCASQLGEGTTFTVVLPIIREKEGHG